MNLEVDQCIGKVASGQIGMVELLNLLRYAVIAIWGPDTLTSLT